MCLLCKLWGGRGVSVCEEWRNDYNSFLKWAKENGWAKGLELDKDIKGDGLLYSAETCVWTTRLENNNHRHVLKKYLYEGDLLTLAAIGRKIGVTKEGMLARKRYGFTGDKLFAVGKIDQKYSNLIFIKNETEFGPYNSLRKAAKEIGCDPSGLRRLVTGEYKQYKSYTLKK